MTSLDTPRRSVSPHVAIIIHRLDALGISRNFFAPLVGVSTALLSQYFTGVKQLPNDAAARFEETVNSLERLVERTRPLRLDFSPEFADDFRKILHEHDEGKLLVSVVDLTQAPTHIEESAKVLNEWAGGLAALAGKI